MIEPPPSTNTSFNWIWIKWLNNLWEEVTSDETTGSGSWVTLSEVTLPSAAFQDFTLPTGVVRFTLLVDQSSFDTVRTPMVQLGDGAPGIEATGYLSQNAFQSGATTTNTANTTGFIIPHTATADEWSGRLEFVLMDSATNKWMMSGHTFSTASGTEWGGIAGVKSLSAELTTVRITSFTGGGVFTNGTATVSYWIN